ncbi:hypothetical protein M407DRAFT_34409 [Tulasnella calospora MUT 4182]|uniref:Uncharacterized protein n=1 Tax=Tulasnella calospora MUT 4182 TaxID=1051891 RepID=A0A0C3Q0P8_9AGAM|nr:hypothetical protein M407DRAFT_34409 [Tulasnella calospora MUT 4182]
MAQLLRRLLRSLAIDLRCLDYVDFGQCLRGKGVKAPRASRSNRLTGPATFGE